MSKTLLRQLMVNATMNVSVFMTISGFMQWMTIWKRQNNEYGKAGWFAVVLHRYLRMFPLVTITACFHQLHPTSGHGPTWSYHTELRRKAFPENWHHYLLGTLNFIDLDSICSPQQWYTSADFQCFVFMLFFTIRLKRLFRALIRQLLQAPGLSAPTIIQLQSSATHLRDIIIEERSVMACDASWDSSSPPATGAQVAVMQPAFIETEHLVPGPNRLVSMKQQKRTMPYLKFIQFAHNHCRL
ncbi:uncharacterized protein LOC142558375 [Dermacentor variabilis]|uniref:uncharacterized protein LOC142558375 n=1 Tax=Dermacentor variabilis TaxID=34621 RepID=UPI003F5B2C3E